MEHLKGASLGKASKHLTRLERLAKDKRSSLLQAFVNYVRKKIYNIEPKSRICGQTLTLSGAPILNLDV